MASLPKDDIRPTSHSDTTPLASTQECKEALGDMVWQFAYRFDGAAKRPPSLGTGGLSALEHAFGVLDWPDPKKCPEASCDIQGCQKWPGSGNPIPNGDYWSLCTDHMMMLNDDKNHYLYMKKKVGRGYNTKERKERLARR